MKKILLIGATGQLGGKVFKKLLKTGLYDIRILVRKDSTYDHLKTAGPEIVFGDLKDANSVDTAVKGCDIVITTANSAAPRKKEDTFDTVDIEGYRHLIDAAERYGIEQFIYTSAIMPDDEKWQRWVPLVRSKVQTEAYLKDSNLDYTIIRPAPFMDVYFAFMGTTIPIRNEEAPLVERPFKFMQSFYNGIKDDVANGKIGIIGDGKVKHSYIAIENVADFIVKSVGNGELYNETINVGGPEALSALDVKAIFENVLNEPLTVKRTPAFMMKLLGNVMAPFNPAASNIFKLNYMQSTIPMEVDCIDLADHLDIDLISAEDFLWLKVEGMAYELDAV